MCFDTVTPPILEEIQFHRALTGDDMIDSQKYKRRIGSLHPGHERVAPYAQQLRLVLHNEWNKDMEKEFRTLSEVAGLPVRTKLVDCSGPRLIEASRRDFFSAKNLDKISKCFSELEWVVAFQLECLLHNV